MNSIWTFINYVTLEDFLRGWTVLWCLNINTIWIKKKCTGCLGFLGSVVKKLPANAGDLGSIPGLGRSPGEGNGNPLQYSCPGNPILRGAWWATVQGVTRESDMTWRLNLASSNLAGRHRWTSCGPSLWFRHEGDSTALTVPSGTWC